MAGVEETGFVLKRLPEILTELRQEAVEIFQDLVPPGEVVVDTSDSSVLGRLISLVSPSLTDLWEAAQENYAAFDPNSATGIALDNLVQYSGIARFGNSYSTAPAVFSGDNNTLIPGGTTVKAEQTNNEFVVLGSVALSPSQASGVSISVQNVLNNTVYSFSFSTNVTDFVTVSYTSSSSATSSEILNGLASQAASLSATIQVSVSNNMLVVDKVDVFQASNFSVSANLSITKVRKVGQLQATEYGPVEQEANTVQSIVTPILGWDSVTNPLSASLGRLKETDEELRLRFRNTKLERSTNILDSLYSALFNVENVKEVAIYENDTDVVDSNGVSPHSFLPVVLGGSSQLIGEAIWLNKPMGISSEGNTTVTIVDSQGFSRPISFERPNPVSIYVEIVLSMNDESLTPFPSNGVELIKEEIQKYSVENFGIGKDIVYSRLFTPINKIAGHQVDSMLIGSSPGSMGVTNIPIEFNEIGSFESVNINIVIV